MIVYFLSPFLLGFIFENGTKHKKRVQTSFLIVKRHQYHSSFCHYAVYFVFFYFIFHRLLHTNFHILISVGHFRYIMHSSCVQKKANIFLVFRSALNPNVFLFRMLAFEAIKMVRRTVWWKKIEDIAWFCARISYIRSSDSTNDDDCV